MKSLSPALPPTKPRTITEILFILLSVGLIAFVSFMLLTTNPLANLDYGFWHRSLTLKFIAVFKGAMWLTGFAGLAVFGVILQRCCQLNSWSLTPATRKLFNIGMPLLVFAALLGVGVLGFTWIAAKRGTAPDLVEWIGFVCLLSFAASVSVLVADYLECANAPDSV